ncbi:sulfite oxidase [Nonomuraea mesophila]|uniref:Sulfite oxidase n=1 Tax=Nonomuraea mesophila TaxID=2530382 RepID=A0A4R5EME5_9ACTN|nr:sulfite oxidase [Nonomuraea mesophila]TDE35732.1 sulfite oxidase [Nonomuraea mesophila]
MKQATATIVKPLPDHLFRVHGQSAEMRWQAMSGVGYHTPNERFFVRNHTFTPLIDATTWRLRVHGAGVRWPREFGYDEVRAMPSRTLDVAIECAGNGRRFYGTQQHDAAPGTQWGLGAVGVARWRGVLLKDLLKEAGVRPEAVDVLPTGLDAPFEHHGHVRRPLPIGKAMADVLVAYEMNGVPLPADHGFPARLVVPGWVGVASIKWLGDIEVATSELRTPWNTVFYPEVTTNPAKSAFELAWNARVPAGGQRILHGRSWSGRGRIARVEVSLDGGASWREAEHHGRHLVSAWLPWHIAWAPRRTGPHVLMARATDASGATQPLVTPRHPFGYHFDAVVRHPVEVVAG